MNPLYTSNDNLVLEDEGDTVYLEAVQGAGAGWADLSITDVESIHEWTREWLRKRTK